MIVFYDSEYVNNVLVNNKYTFAYIKFTFKFIYILNRFSKQYA